MLNNRIRNIRSNPYALNIRTSGLSMGPRLRGDDGWLGPRLRGEDGWWDRYR